MTRRRAAAALGAVALGLALLAAAGCGAGDKTAAGASPSAGKQLFVSKCGGCHTLADAGTNGVTGPNLDEAFKYVRDDSLDQQGFEESTIRDVVRGQIAHPTINPVTGEAGMPANLVKGEDADSVAAYVASVAGLPVKGGGGGGGGKDPKSLFTSNCAGCHTLAAAGASGTIGPNLDDLKPSRPAAAKQIANGGGAMPPFKGKLTDAQIDALATWVADNAGK